MSKNNDEIIELIPGACCGCFTFGCGLLFLGLVAAGVVAAWKAVLA